MTYTCPLTHLTHNGIVVLFQPEYGMLEKRNTVAIPVQEHGQVVVNVSLSEIVRQLVKIQHSLRNLQSVIIDSTVRVLSQAEFLSKQPNRRQTECHPSSLGDGRGAKEVNEVNTLPEFGYSSNRLVQCVVGHVVLWCRGLMTEG